MTMHADNDGRLLLTLDAPPVGGENFSDGISYTSDLQLYAVTVKPSPAYSQSGLTVSKDGQVFIVNNGVVASYNAGFPLNSAGALCVLYT